MLKYNIIERGIFALKIPLKIPLFIKKRIRSTRGEYCGCLLFMKREWRLLDHELVAVHDVETTLETIEAVGGRADLDALHVVDVALLED